MQVLFKAIVSGDVDKVRERLEKDPDAANLVATAPPKQFAGMSPLQVCYHKGAYEIAALLLDHGADPNFCDLNPFDKFGMPVLHSAIGAAVANSRRIRRTGPPHHDPEWELAKTAERADAAFNALRRLLDAGADIAATNTHGGSALGFAASQARQFLPRCKYGDPEWVDPKPLNDELVDDLNRIFDLLLANGADPAFVEPPFGKPLAECYAAEPVGRFLARSASTRTSDMHR
ncbi:ankyrin repeat domain-containing protein [Propionibacteriaceae bacterium Y2011]